MNAIPFGLSFIQAIEAICVIVISVAVLLIVVAFVLDKLNVKSFSFHNGFTFYQDGEPRRRVNRRRKNAR